MTKASLENGATSAESAAVVFARYGLVSAGSSDTGMIPSDESRPDAVAAGFCDALARLGGIYGTFAHFLRWRADLLQGSYLSHLRRVPLNLPPVPRYVVAELVRRDFGETGVAVATALSDAPVWNTPFRTAYSSMYRSVPVIVQVARAPIDEAGLLAFEKSLAALARPELAAVADSSLIAQFREYVRNGESLTRERSFLDVLTHERVDTLVDYPRLIPELSSSSVLCWEAMKGRPIADLIELGEPSAAVLVATVALEQFFSLAIVEADLDLDSIVVDTDGRPRLRRLDNPIAVLPGVIDTGIKYVSSVVAGNAPRAAQMLIRLMISQPPLDLEKQLMEEFSGVEPDLKINMWFPPSAAAFESNWRALTRIAGSRPLFVDCLHRNLLATGYWNAEAVGNSGQTRDAIAEAMWPTVNKLIRNELGSLANRESAQDWALSSAMLMASAFRAINRSVEEVRENDITVGVDISDWRPPARKEPSRAHAFLLGALFVMFLVSVQWGSAFGEPVSTILKVVAAGALGAMFWAISKIN